MSRVTADWVTRWPRWVSRLKVKGGRIYESVARKRARDVYANQSWHFGDPHARQSLNSVRYLRILTHKQASQSIFGQLAEIAMQDWSQKISQRL